MKKLLAVLGALAVGAYAVATGDFDTAGHVAARIDDWPH